MKSHTNQEGKVKNDNFLILNILAESASLEILKKFGELISVCKEEWNDDFSKKEVNVQYLSTYNIKLNYYRWNTYNFIFLDANYVENSKFYLNTKKNGIHNKIVKLCLNPISIKSSTILIKSYSNICTKISFIKEIDSTVVIFVSTSSTTNVFFFHSITMFIKHYYLNLCLFWKILCFYFNMYS